MNQKSPKPIHFKISKSENHALLVQIDEGRNFYTKLHYHPEFQITAIVKGEGVLYAGNSMTSFQEKDVFLIGPNVPHLIKNTTTNKAKGIRAVSLFFDEYSFGKQFFDIKEMNSIRQLLSAGNRVIKVEEGKNDMVFEKICSAEFIKDEQLVISFLELLSQINAANKEYINGEEYSLILNRFEGGRLNEVLDYVFRHFDQEISIEQISNIACLSRSQFSYFFKLHTGKTFVEFLNRLRIEQACILLKKDSMTIDQVCFNTGFNNVSNFIRHFKKVKKETPSKYRKSWKIN